MFRSFRLGARLLIAFASLIVLGAVAAGFGIYGLQRLNDANDSLYERELQGISFIKESNVNLIYAARARGQFALASSDEERQAARQSFKTAVDDMRTWLEKARPLFYTPAGREQLNKLDALIKTWLPAAEAYFVAAASQALASADPELVKLDLAVRQSNKLVDEQLTLLSRYKEENGEQAAKEGTALYTNVSVVLVVLTLVSAITGVVVGTLMTRGITRALGGEPGDLAVVANAVAAGDLTTRIDISRARPGSVVAALEHMQKSLRNVVSQVRASSDSIATGSSQIAAGNADLSQRTEEQASNLEETAASMEELTATVKTNADSVRLATEFAGTATAAADQGGVVVGQVVSTMQGITESSKKISDIIGVIDGIAFQTNILALNAAVEAARAGEQGRGFAVVATEVRTLAQRSAAAAKEIKGLITESVDKVMAGSDQAGKAGVAMDDIVSQIKRLNDLLNDIGSATQEQSQGISQVGEAVNQLDQVTQQNAALVEESAAAADSLNHQAARLVEAVSIFRLEAGEQIRTTGLTQPVAASVATSSAASKRVARPEGAKAALAAPVKTNETRNNADDWTSF